MAPVLECIGIRKSFGGFSATSGIDLTVEKGEIIGIIGSNGAGKTTLLNIVSGHLRPTAGKVVVDGHDVTGHSPRTLVRRGVARSFQIPQLFGRSTTRENMMLALSLLCEPQRALLRRFKDAGISRRADRILASYGLDAHADASVGQLPQGVRKLLDIAMATCADPRLVLLDEPTSGVSADEKNGLMQALAQRFRDDGTTVVFIEHDMDIVRDYATRVVALFEGRIICEGPAETVFRDERVVELIVGRAPIRGAHA